MSMIVSFFNNINTEIRNAKTSKKVRLEIRKAKVFNKEIHSNKFASNTLKKQSLNQLKKSQKLAKVKLKSF